MDRYIAAKRVGLLGILGNIFLLCIKAAVGFLFKSQAMIADSVNSASDIFASLMTFIGNKIAREPEDNTHNLGHGKAEYIFSLFISLSMILVALKLLFDSIYTLINGSELTFSWLLVIVCIVKILLKSILFLYTYRLAKKHNNILLNASYEDHRNDCIVTTFTLLSILATLIGIHWLDGVVGIGISIWICITGIKLFIGSYNILMDISIDENTKDIILDLVHSYKDIKKVDEFYSTPIGYQYVVFLTIYVDGNLSTFASHNLADSLERDICKLEKISKAIVHVNPI